jgi:hypothetical protein
MKIYYPTYYVVPVVPVMFLNEEEYNLRNRCDNMEEEKVYNTYINANKSIFEKIDEEYVNESTK